MKPVLDWHFKAINPTEYEVSLDFSAENKLFLKIFTQARIKLLRKKGIDAKGDLSKIDRFPVPEMYLNTLRTAIRPAMARIRKEIGEDKIVLLTWGVKDCNFIRAGEDWRIKIDVNGMYADKR